MIYKELGSSGVDIPAIGQGTRGAGSRAIATAQSVAQRIEVLRYGIELGMTFLDMAESYEGGHTEEIVGQAITGIRDKVFLSTKFDPKHNSFKGVINALEGSLHRLKTDYVDLYQIHWPNPSIPLQETMRALEKIISGGKTRFVGVCNFTANQVLAAQSMFLSRIVSNQLEYNLFERSTENDFLPVRLLLPVDKGAIKTAKITLIAYSPYRQGRLNFTRAEAQTLERLAEKYRKTKSQIILNWIISHPTVVTIPQSMSFEHTKENAEATNFALSKDDIEKINDTFKQEAILVLPSRIRVVNYDVDDSHPIYTTLEEAIENPLNIQPSPIDLAKEIMGGNILKPVNLVPTLDKSGKYDYDLIQGRVRYWAWVIAHRNKKPIPATIRSAE